MGTIVLCVDLEATCWRGHPPPGMQVEVIEIGVCALDIEAGERVARVSWLIKPATSEISSFCTELTSITPQMVANAPSFSEACSQLVAQFGRCPWTSWGDWDAKQMRRQCTAFGVPFPFADDHLNAKKLFSRQYHIRPEAGLKRAVAHVGIEFDGTAHRGVDDAWNTGGVILHLLREFQLDWPAVKRTMNTTVVRPSRRERRVAKQRTV